MKRALITLFQLFTLDRWVNVYKDISTVKISFTVIINVNYIIRQESRIFDNYNIQDILQEIFSSTIQNYHVVDIVHKSL